MSNEILLGNLQVRCRFPILTLQQCRIYAKYGEHTQADIVCTVKSGEVRASLTNMEEEKLEIVNKEEDSGEAVLFSGIIHRAELTEEGRYAMLLLQAVSNTWKMDIERKSRSFQNLSLTYRDIVNSIAQEYHTDLCWNIPDVQLKHPLIQYQETDYCFIKRIISQLKSGITSGDSKEGIELHAGLRKGNHIGNIAIDKYRHSMIPPLNRYDKLQMLGYEIADMDYVRVGDVLQIRGTDFYVMEAATTFEQNVLSCTCRVFPFQCFEKEKILADTLKGTVLSGTVLRTGQEFLKMHLDIDKEQLVEGAFDFPWKPITGNLLYCMPETGTRAALYFSESDETSASVIYNIRDNGEECGELADYNNRYLTTDNDKRMYLMPSKMGFLNMTDQNAEIALKDNAMIQVKTKNQVSILAEGHVELKGQNVSITTPLEATLVRKDIISPTVINLCNAFDAIGKNGNFTASESIPEKKKRVPDMGYKSEEYSLKGAISTIFCNIPAESEKNMVLEAIAGSMPVITKMPVKNI